MVVNALLLTIAAVSPAQEVPAPLAEQAFSCSTNGLDRLIGKRARRRDMGAMIAHFAGVEAVRWVRWRRNVTLEPNAARINVYLDKRGIITGFRCG